MRLFIQGRRSAAELFFKAASPSKSTVLTSLQTNYYSSLVTSCGTRTSTSLVSKEDFRLQMATPLADAALRHLFISSRPFSATSNRHQLKAKTDSAMLSSYLARFMSTVQQYVEGASDVKKIKNDLKNELLTDLKVNKQVQINACSELYIELSKTKPILFSGAPHEGIRFNVKYYDSLELIDASSKKANGGGHPTVCFLHGAPGHYKDFADIIYLLTRRGVRVIAPNFPDYEATFQHSFRHSPRERLDFLLEFFNKINVNQVDLLAGHSSAVYTMFELLNHSYKAQSDTRRIKIRSLGLLSTPSHVLPHNLAVTPFRLFTLKLFDYPILRPFILIPIQAFVRVQGIRNRVDKNKIEDLLIAASAMGYSQHSKMADRLQLLHKFKIPAILVYGTRDKLITVNNFKQLENDLGIISEDQVKVYKSDGSVESPVRQRHELVDVSRFESGGHYTFQRYSSQVGEDVYNFLVERGLLTEMCDDGTNLSNVELEVETTKL